MRFLAGRGRAWRNLAALCPAACVLVVAMGIAGCARSAGRAGSSPAVAQPAAGGGPVLERTTIRTPDGLAFDAVIHRPGSGSGQGWGVLMIGGGLGNDLDWSVPGEVTVGGQRVVMTLDGRPHADGPAIAAALADRGFTVLRWSTIARGDPLAAKWPMEATPRSLADLLEQSRAALAVLRATEGVGEEKILLLGHSLGAARAGKLAAKDTGVRGLVLLSPAYFSRPGEGVHVPQAFDRGEMIFTADVVSSRSLPCLTVFGSADTSRVVNAAGVAGLVGRPEFQRLEVRIDQGLGHTLGPVQDSRVGPIDGKVLEAIAQWAEALAKE